MGRGVATTRPFHKDEFVVEYTGVLVTGLYEIHARRPEYRSARKTRGKKTTPSPCYEFQFSWKGKKYWLVILH